MLFPKKKAVNRKCGPVRIMMMMFREKWKWKKRVYKIELDTFDAKGLDILITILTFNEAILWNDRNELFDDLEKTRKTIVILACAFHESFNEINERKYKEILDITVRKEQE